MEEREYIAFISYRHRPLDKQAAEKIQRHIEGFRVPKEFRETVGGDRLGMVFRDEDELPASSSLSDSITYALDHTKFLIVICTPDLPLSQWCETEIRYFLKTHDRDHVLAVLADGEPEQSFSPYLRFDYDEEGNVKAEVEPLAADIRGKDHTIDRKKFRKEIVRLYAALIGCPFDALWQRQKRQQTNRLLILAAGAFAVMAVFLGVVLQKNSQISAQNRDLALQRSTLLVDAGQQKLEEYDIQEALENASQALPQREKDPYDHRAARVLSEALGAYRIDGFRKELSLKHSAQIIGLCTMENSGRIILADWFGAVSCYDMDSQAFLWSADGYVDHISGVYQNDHDDLRLELDEEGKRVFCLNSYDIVCLSVEDGQTLWTYEKTYAAGLHVFSEDYSHLAVIRQTDEGMGVEVLDTKTGQAATAFSLEEEGFKPEIGLDILGADLSIAGCFSRNGRYLSIGFKQSSEENAEEMRFRFVTFDMKAGVLSMDLVENLEEYPNLQSILNLHINEDGSEYYVVRYDQQDYAVNTILVSKDLSKNSLVGAASRVGITDAKNARTVFSDHLAVLSIGRSVYLFRLDSNTMTNHIDFEGEVLNIEWRDIEEEVLRVYLRSGEVQDFDLEHEGDLSYQPFNDAWQWEQTGEIKLAGSLAGETWVIVDQDAPQKLFQVRSVADPHGQVFLQPERLISDIYLSPSGDKIYTFSYDQEGDPVVTTYDSETFEPVNTATYPGFLYYSGKNMAIAADGRIYIGSDILTPDGGHEYLGDMGPEAAADFYVKNLSRHKTLYNGQTATVSGTLVMWEDGPVPSYFSLRALLDNAWTEARIKPDNDSVYALGGNGLLVTRGLLIEKAEDEQVSLASEEPAYQVLDILNEKVITLEDLAPEAMIRITAVGEKEPVFCVADDEGKIYCYHTEKGGRLLAKTGGLRVKAMTFLDEDRYLAVQNYAGELTIYRVSDGAVMLKEETVLVNPGAYDGYIDAAISEDGTRAFLIGKEGSRNYGPCLILDLESMTVIAEADKVCKYLPKTNEILVMDDYTGQIDRFPIYSLEDLLNWRQE